MSRVPALAALLVFSPALVAQQVLVVDDGGGPGVFSTQIQPAIDASGPLDVVLVRPGGYSGFTIDAKSATVVGDDDGTPDVFVNGSVVVTNVGASDRVLLQRLTISGGGAASPELEAVLVADCAGVVWLDRCTAYGGSLAPLPRAGLRVSGSLALLVTRCLVQGSPSGLLIPGATGLDAAGSVVEIHSTSVQGGQGLPAFAIAADGGAGLTIAGGTLVSHGSTFTGGAGGGSFSFAGANGGAGIVANGPVARLGGQVAGGAAGTGNPPGVPGPAVAGSTPVVEIGGSARLFGVTSPVRELQPISITFQGIAGEIAAMLVSTAPVAPVFLPELDGSIVVDLAPAQVFSFGVVPAPGSVVSIVPAPALPPSMLGATLHLQSIFVETAPLDAVLGPAAALVLLDSSL